MKRYPCSVCANAECCGFAYLTKSMDEIRCEVADSIWDMLDPYCATHFIMNQDKSATNTIKVKIIKNHDADVAGAVEIAVRNNDGYCPCRAEKTPETKCMCADFRQQYKDGKLGECHCGLYEVVKA